jgi:hypothetical protein
MSKKLVIAGPVMMEDSLSRCHLGWLVSDYLYKHYDFNEPSTIICAPDTITGYYARKWAEKHSVRFSSHIAFQKNTAHEYEVAKLYEDRISGDMREAIIRRNMSMMAEEGIYKVLLFNSASECNDFVIAARSKPETIDIVRILV